MLNFLSPKAIFSIFALLLSISFFALPTSEVKAEGYFTFNNNLKIGTTYKADTKELQNFLNNQGYNSGTVDGKFGPKTKMQVILFQSASGLTPDGSVGPITRGYINRLQALLPYNPNPVVNPPVVPEPTPLNRTLKLSMTGNDVLALQTYLNAHGYDVGTADGKFGPKTQAKVILFQVNNGLTPDGSVGPMTRSAINNVNNPVVTPSVCSNHATNYPTCTIFAPCTNGAINPPTCSIIPDTIKPVVTSFSIPTTYSSLTVPVSNLIASDNNAIVGYLLTETSTPPLLTSLWQDTKPTSYTFSSEGHNKYLYAWVKDSSGNISFPINQTVTVTLTCSGSATSSCNITNGTGSQSRTCSLGTWSNYGSCTLSSCNTGYQISGNSCITTVIPDTTLPIISLFTIPTASSSLIVSISSLSGTDNVGITGYLLTETYTKPSSGSNSWTISKPTIYTFTSSGTKYLYAWAKDAAGNVSTSISRTVTITLPVTLTPQLSVDYLDPLAANGSTTDYFIVTSNIAWTISSYPSWVTLSPASGSGTKNIYVTVGTNTGTQRSGTITVTGPSVSPASLSVSQLAGTTTTCSGSTTTSCSITNGTGSQSRTCNNGTWVLSGSCTLALCNNGYTQSGNTCVVNTTTPPVSTTGNTYYLSPAGSDSNSGTKASPWFTLTRAWSAPLAAGDTIYLRGGTYAYSTKQTLSGKNGKSGSMINVLAYPGETPVFTDASNFNEGGWPQALILFYGDYFYWRGLEISHVEQRPDGSGAGAIVVIDSDNNIFEQFNVHHNANGFEVRGTSNRNLVLNGDFHQNNDPYGQNADGTAYPYGNADGLAFDFTTAGVTNTVRGSRMWDNSDDGLDLYDGEGNVIVDNSWTWYNGFAPDSFSNGGDGNGFKLGDTQTNTPNTVIRTVTNSISYANKAWGFQDNSAKGNMKLYNNIAYQNCYKGYADWCGGFTFTMSGVPYYIKNNISYNNSGSDYSLNVLTNVSNNSWNGGVTVNDNDFASLDASQLSAPRKADGSLPDISFLHLASNSDLIDKGVNVGLPYNGSAPDLGAFETGGVLGATTYNFTLNLKYGSTGNEVIELQKLLIRGGYLKKGSSDGIYGTLTLNAVKEYQKANELTSDGIVGSLTREILNK